MRRTLRRLLRDERAVTVVELALLVPILLLLSVGTFEASRFIMVNQKLTNGSYILADLVARDRTISEGQLDNIFLAMRDRIRPFDFQNDGRAILTSVGALVDDSPFVNWQRVGAGGLDTASAVGPPGGAATLPGGLSIRASETVIVAEVFFVYRPIFDLISEPVVLRKVAYYRPRLGTLETVLP